MLNLLRDQLIERTTTPAWLKDPTWRVRRPPQHHADGTWLATTAGYGLTTAGREMALRYLSAQPID